MVKEAKIEERLKAKKYISVVPIIKCLAVYCMEERIKEKHKNAVFSIHTKYKFKISWIYYIVLHQSHIQSVPNKLENLAENLALNSGI